MANPLKKSDKQNHFTTHTHSQQIDSSGAEAASRKDRANSMRQHRLVYYTVIQETCHH